MEFEDDQLETMMAIRRWITLTPAQVCFIAACRIERKRHREHDRASEKNTKRDMQRQSGKESEEEERYGEEATANERKVLKTSVIVLLCFCIRQKSQEEMKLHMYQPRHRRASDEIPPNGTLHYSAPETAS